MSKTYASPSPSPAALILAAFIRFLLIFDTLALLFAAAIHVNGASIPLGGTVFNEPQMVYAAIVEGLAGVFFAVSAFGAVAGRVWAWTWAIGAHIFAILGFLLGLYATRNGTSPFNFTYHRVMLVIFVAGLILVLLPVGRSALGHNGRTQKRSET